MRILQVCPRYYPNIGGVEEHVRNMSERLVKNHEVTVATTDPTGKLSKEEVINDVKIVRFKSWAPSASYYFSGSLKKYLKETASDFDILHAHSYHAFPALYAAEAKDCNKFVFTSHYHGTGHTLFRSLLHGPYKLFGGKIFDKADKIVCVSEYEKSLVKAGFNVDEKKLEVIPNGVNFEEFRSLKKPIKHGKTILCICRLEKYKGVQYLIEALPKINNGVSLEIVGNGPYSENLSKLVRKKGMVDRVRFSHNLTRDELLEKYAESDVFVLLSSHEAYGLCVAEALAAGTPCIVADNSALSEWIDERNVFGIRNPISLDELASCVKMVIGKSVDAPALQDWDNVAQKIVTLYKCA